MSEFGHPPTNIHFDCYKCHRVVRITQAYNTVTLMYIGNRVNRALMRVLERFVREIAKVCTTAEHPRRNHPSDRQNFLSVCRS